MARRALDFLVGFTLSPVLWRKLPGSKSAGRVQSVALKIISEREIEIEKFVPQEYWSLHGKFTNKEDKLINSRLTFYDGKKVDKLDIKNNPLLDQDGIFPSKCVIIPLLNNLNVGVSPAPI